MTKKEICERAKTIIEEAMSIAYYRLADNINGWRDDMTDEEVLECTEWINRYGTSMMKVIGREYYTL